jgi:transposase
MRFVELGSETRIEMQSLHRARDRLVGERTALINQLRAFLLERGPPLMRRAKETKGFRPAPEDAKKNTSGHRRWPLV